MEHLQTILANLPEIVTAVNGVLLAITALALLIPGNQPEDTLKKITDFISKFSRK